MSPPLQHTQSFAIALSFGRESSSPRCAMRLGRGYKPCWGRLGTVIHRVGACSRRLGPAVRVGGDSDPVWSWEARAAPDQTGSQGPPVGNRATEGKTRKARGPPGANGWMEEKRVQGRTRRPVTGGSLREPEGHGRLRWGGLQARQSPATVTGLERCSRPGRPRRRAPSPSLGAVRPPRPSNVRLSSCPPASANPFSIIFIVIFVHA